MDPKRAKLFYAKWADTDKRPESFQLMKWSIEGWQLQKLRDQLRAIADLKHSIALGDDPFLRTCLAYEETTFRHIKAKCPLDAPVIDGYIPRKVDTVWLQARRAELERQRNVFSTFAYWKDPEPERPVMNSIAQALTNQITRFDEYASVDWQGPMDAFAQYVHELEELLVFVRTAHNEGGDRFCNPMTLKLLRDLLAIHRKAQVEIMDRNLGISFRAWETAREMEDGYYRMDMATYVGMDVSEWNRPKSGVPLVDDPDLLAAIEAGDLEDLSNKRRAALDEMISNWSKKRYVLVKGFVLRERKVWGQLLMAIAQKKRHGTWEIEGYAHSSKVEA